MVYPGFRASLPHEEFRAIAGWCEANDVVHDVYGEGRALQTFEAKIAGLLGKPAAVFMPSGTLAQLIAIRIWTHRAGLDRFGMPPTSHLMLHEREAYQALLHLHGAPVGERRRPLLASDLAAASQPLACLLVELPLREIGGQLPSWEELEALKAVAKGHGIALHMDGARLWECAAFYRRTFAQIAEGFSSVYVSLYKGVGGLAGAVLAGDADFIAEARLWQRRLGGNLVGQTAMLASAALRLDARLAALPACYERALSLAHGLEGVSGLRVEPTTPQTNMMHIFLDAPPEAVTRRRDEMAAEDGVWVINEPRAADVPGWSVTELYVGDTLVGIENAEVVGRIARLLG